jgi:hypothetical protein
MFDETILKMFSVNHARFYVIKNYNQAESDEVLSRLSEDFTRSMGSFLESRYKLDFRPSNAFTKLWEVYKSFDIFSNMDKYKSNEQFVTFHMCEAPGYFIKCTEYYINKHFNKSNGRINHKWFANSLNPYNEKNKKRYGKVFGDNYGYIKNNRNKWLWAADNTGDITKVDNINWFRNYFKSNSIKLNIITGDAGLDLDTNNLIDLQRLDYSQMLMTLACSSIGTDCVIKIFLPYIKTKEESYFSTEFYIGIIYMYILSFRHVYLFKPYTSRPLSGEYYIIGKDFTGVSDDIFNKLIKILNNFSVNKPLFNIEDIPDSIISQIYKFIDSLADLVNTSEEKFYFFLTCHYDEDVELKKISKCDKILEKEIIENIFQKRYEKWTKLFW